MDNGKIGRVLGIYTKLLDGYLVNKSEEALNYGVNERTIQRDIDDSDIDAVLDRLPTARILDECVGVYTVSSEVFGKGIDMWIRSQGDVVEMIG